MSRWNCVWRSDSYSDFNPFWDLDHLVKFDLVDLWASELLILVILESIKFFGSIESTDLVDWRRCTVFWRLLISFWAISSILSNAELRCSRRWICWQSFAWRSFQYFSIDKWRPRRREYRVARDRVSVLCVFCGEAMMHSVNEKLRQRKKNWILLVTEVDIMPSQLPMSGWKFAIQLFGGCGFSFVAYHGYKNMKNDWILDKKYQQLTDQEKLIVEYLDNKLLEQRWRAHFEKLGRKF